MGLNHYLSARVRTFAQVDRFIERAGNWLLSREAEHNLALGICRQLMLGQHAFRDPIYLATIETEREVNGVAFRTPPFKLGLTRMPLDCMDELVASVASTYDSLPAVLGPETHALVFAEKWARLKGLDFEAGMRNGIHSLTEVINPSPWPRGDFRRATPDDEDLAIAWTRQFSGEARIATEDPMHLIPLLIQNQSLFFWCDGTAVSMAAAMAPTPNGVRLGLVYTPAEHRRQGFASACVARLSRLQLGRGRKFCFLYTDAANPTANSIYQKIGYRAVAEAIDVVFV